MWARTMAVLAFSLGAIRPTTMCRMNIAIWRWDCSHHSYIVLDVRRDPLSFSLKIRLMGGHLGLTRTTLESRCSFPTTTLECSSTVFESNQKYAIFSLNDRRN